MKTARFVLALMLVTSLASAGGKPEDWKKNAEEARASGKYAFCSNPRKPVLGRAQMLCSLADEVPDCEGFKKACNIEEPKPPPSWLAGFLESLGSVAKVLVWVLIAIIVMAILYPVIRGIMNARRDKKLADQKTKKPNVAVAFEPPPPPEPEEITDAEAALRAADDLARAGENERALGMYLAASLAALDRRGSIRLGKHKTNGEYVRGCTDGGARQPLREIVREVDRATFGHQKPDGAVVSGVASKATALVRHIAMSTLVLFLFGCNALNGVGGGPNDPAGDDLPIDVLKRSGFDVQRVGRSLASLPMPSESNDHALLVIDLMKVTLEEETAAHLMRYIDDGGRVALLGPVSLWPKEMKVKSDPSTGRDVRFDFEGDWITGAKVASYNGLEWEGSLPIAEIGKEQAAYAATKWMGRGLVIGVAGADLLTNIGVARPENAAALVGILSYAEEHTIKIARAEDGIPPPDGPFAALARAGLLKGMWHALAAAVLLFLAYGIRHARAKRPAPEARRAFAEHVEANGALYARTRAWSLALSSYAQYAEMRLRERAPRGTDPIAFIAARNDKAVEDVQKVWARAMSATADAAPRGDELQTIRDLRALLAKALA